MRVSWAVVALPGAVALVVPLACEWDSFEESVALDPQTFVLEGGETRELRLQLMVEASADSNVEAGAVTVLVAVEQPEDAVDSASADTAAPVGFASTLAGLNLLVSDGQGNDRQGDLSGTHDSITAYFNVCDGPHACRESPNGACDLDGGDDCAMAYSLVLFNHSDEAASVSVVVTGTIESYKDPVQDASIEISLE